jgi:hypothetical protein
LALGQNWGIASKGLAKRTTAPSPKPMGFNMGFIEIPLTNKWWIGDMYALYTKQALLSCQAAYLLDALI